MCRLKPGSSSAVGPSVCLSVGRRRQQHSLSGFMAFVLSHAGIFPFPFNSFQFRFHFNMKKEKQCRAIIVAQREPITAKQTTRFHLRLRLGCVLWVTMWVSAGHRYWLWVCVCVCVCGRYTQQHNAKLWHIHTHSCILSWCVFFYVTVWTCGGMRTECNQFNHCTHNVVFLNQMGIIGLHALSSCPNRFRSVPLGARRSLNKQPSLTNSRLLKLFMTQISKWMGK